MSTQWHAAAAAMTIGGIARSASPELFKAFAAARPVAAQLWGRAEKVPL